MYINIYFNVRAISIPPPYLEVQDKSPDQTQDQLLVAVHDLIIPDVDQFDALLHLEEVQGILHVLQLVHPHVPLLFRLHTHAHTHTQVISTASTASLLASK